MPNGIEADRVQFQSLLDGGRDFREWEGLQQAQHLDILARRVFLQPCFEQPAQVGETVGQLPTGKWSRLIESPALLFEQRQIVRRIVDRNFPLLAARVGSDYVAAGYDHDPVDVGLDEYLAMAELDWHRVVVGLVANQRDRADANCGLGASLKARSWQRQQYGTITLEPLANGLRVAAQASRTNCSLSASQLVAVGIGTMKLRRV